MMSSINTYIQKICDMSPNQMSFDEREIIYNIISQSECKNLLVFGAGNDSKLWSMSSDNTVVLENDEVWLNKISAKYEDIIGLEFMRVIYRMFDTEQECFNAIKYDDDSMLKVDVCDSIFNIKWDAIIVDSPTGYRSRDEYYRAGSIKLASQLASSDCHVFIHDCNRRIESAAVSKFMSDRQSQTIDRLNILS